MFQLPATDLVTGESITPFVAAVGQLVCILPLPVSLTVECLTFIEYYHALETSSSEYQRKYLMTHPMYSTRSIHSFLIVVLDPPVST